MAAELVGDVPVLGHRVDVYRGLEEQEGVDHSGRYHERLDLLAAQVDDGAVPLGGGASAEIVQKDAGPPLEEDEIVPVPDVDVGATKNIRQRSNDVPLHGADPRNPLVAEEFGERSSVVDMGEKRNFSDARRELRGR